MRMLKGHEKAPTARRPRHGGDVLVHAASASADEAPDDAAVIRRHGGVRAGDLKAAKTARAKAALPTAAKEDSGSNRCET